MFRMIPCAQQERYWRLPILKTCAHSQRQSRIYSGKALDPPWVALGINVFGAARKDMGASLRAALRNIAIRINGVSSFSFFPGLQRLVASLLSFEVGAGELRVLLAYRSLDFCSCTNPSLTTEGRHISVLEETDLFS